MATAAKILEEALALTPDQRVRLVQELLESLDGIPDVPREGSVDAIRAALIEGEASGIAEDSSLDGVLRQFRASRTPLPPPGFADVPPSGPRGCCVGVNTLVVVAARFPQAVLALWAAGIGGRARSVVASC